VSKLLSRKVLVPTAGILAVVVVLFLLPIPKVTLPEISIPAERIFDLFGFPITNTLLATWLTMIILIVGAWLITRKMAMVPRRWQSFLEMFIETLYNLVEGVAGRKWARRFFPTVMTIFVFLLISNWLGLTPLYGSWGVLEPAEAGATGQPVQWLNSAHSVGLWLKGEAAASETGATSGEQYVLAPMFRSAATDLNTTVALALVSMLMVQYFGFKASGIGYFGKFVAVRRIASAFTTPRLGCGGRLGALFMGAIDAFVGLIETISEFGKIISFSFRLFGNIFAGEVLLGVIGFLIPYLVSLPFFGLELFVGFVQALVFMMLTVAFFVTAISSHGEEGH
jgi:F-type H+-transporting ATPase subunit a